MAISGQHQASQEPAALIDLPLVTSGHIEHVLEELEVQVFAGLLFAFPNLHANVRPVGFGLEIDVVIERLLNTDFRKLKRATFVYYRTDSEANSFGNIHGEIEFFRDAAAPDQKRVLDKDTFESPGPQSATGVAPEDCLSVPPEGVFDVHFKCILEMGDLWCCHREADCVPA